MLFEIKGGVGCKGAVRVGAGGGGGRFRDGCVVGGGWIRDVGGREIVRGGG